MSLDMFLIVCKAQPTTPAQTKPTIERAIGQNELARQDGLQH